MNFTYRFIDSPVGQLKLVAKGAALAAILWENDRPNRVLLGPMTEDLSSDILNQVEQQLTQYFAGTRNQFDLPLDFHGTEFQKKVWQALLGIPFGETRSYLQIALAIGNPAAVRAVGAANGKNPISIVAPCHRVIGSSGALTGFAGGLAAKELLLTLEGGMPKTLKKNVNALASAQASLF
jgi:methylated-DNA-[protein]-cysteine S-methyltransferase